VTEAQIKRQICDYLATRKAQIGPYLKFWLNETLVVPGRKRNSPYQLNGLPDVFILGWGSLLTLEIKKPAEKSTPAQVQQQQELEHAGATSAEVHSLEEAIFVIEKWLA